METLRAYLKSLSHTERTAFARRCRTTFGYLRKAIIVGNKLGGGLAVAIDRESGGAVRCEVLRPDIDWSYVRDGVRGEALPEPQPLPPKSPKRRKSKSRKSKSRRAKSRKSKRASRAVDSSPAGAAA